MKSFSVRFLALVAVLSLIGNVLLYMRYSSTRPLVTVGGEVITKKQYQDRLEQQAGQDVLSKMVFEKLVTQAAAREGVTPKPQYIDKQIGDIERRSPQVLEPYHQDPVKMAEFRRDFQEALALENLRIKDVALSPTEVAAYYAKNRKNFALPQQVQVSTVVTRHPEDASTAAALLNQNTPLDVLARQPRLGVVGISGYNPNLKVLPDSIRQQIAGFVKVAKKGEVRTFPVKTTPKLTQPDLFVTFKVNRSDPAALPQYKDISAQVYRQACLEHAVEPKVEIARLYQASKPIFTSDKYAAYFSEIQNLPIDKDSGKKTASEH